MLYERYVYFLSTWSKEIYNNQRSKTIYNNQSRGVNYQIKHSTN